MSGGCSASSTANLVEAVACWFHLESPSGIDRAANDTTPDVGFRVGGSNPSGNLPRAANLRATRQGPLVEVQRFSHATGAASDTGERIIGTVDRHFQLHLQPPVQPEQERAAPGQGDALLH